MDKKVNPSAFSLVVAEGGPKAIKFFKNLMLRRIKWDTIIKKVFIFIKERYRSWEWRKKRRDYYKKSIKHMLNCMGGKNYNKGNFKRTYF